MTHIKQLKELVAAGERIEFDLLRDCNEMTLQPEEFPYTMHRGEKIPLDPRHKDWYRRAYKSRPALKQLLAEHEARQWQPIETAPEETYVLLNTLNNNFQTGYVQTGIYYKPHSGMVSGSTGWRSCCSTFSITPTHWMPLPPTGETK